MLLFTGGRPVKLAFCLLAVPEVSLRVCDGPPRRAWLGSVHTLALAQNTRRPGQFISTPYEIPLESSREHIQNLVWSVGCA
jgi:hypothetical protein